MTTVKPFTHRRTVMRVMEEHLFRVFVAATCLMFCAPSFADEFVSGNVFSVADGDTFTIHDGGISVRVRLCGVDSPERGQPGYAAAAGKMAQMVEGKEVRCVQVGGGTPCDGRSKPTNRDRIVAQCFVDDHDVAMEMICDKKAVDLPKFSAGYYASCRK